MPRHHRDSVRPTTGSPPDASRHKGGTSPPPRAHRASPNASPIPAGPVTISAFAGRGRRSKECTTGTPPGSPRPGPAHHRGPNAHRGTPRRTPLNAVAAGRRIAHVGAPLRRGRASTDGMLGRSHSRGATHRRRQRARRGASTRSAARGGWGAGRGVRAPPEPPHKGARTHAKPANRPPQPGKRNESEGQECAPL